jgi:thiol-disulfide isomerase/thioredoxin
MSDSVSGTPYTNPLKIDASTDNFYKIMDRLEGKSNVYVAFFANWCPDCTSIPTVVETLQTNPEVTVVMCNVGEPMKWRSGDHVFKERAAFMEIEGKQRYVYVNKLSFYVDETTCILIHSCTYVHTIHI